MKPAPFAYHRPAQLDEVLELLAQTPGAKILAGGQSLVPMMNLRVAQPSALIDLNCIGDLFGVRLEGERLLIRAMTRHVDVKNSKTVKTACPLIHRAYDHIAHETVRNRGTFGGNLVHADPASELPAVMVILDAVFVVYSQAGRREIKAADFFVSALTTALREDELLVEVQIPISLKTQHFEIDEFSMRKGDLALAGAATALLASNRNCKDARLIVFGVGDGPKRLTAAEKRLVGSRLSEEDVSEAANLAVSKLAFESTPGVSAEYRRDLTAALVRRVLRAASTPTREAA